MIKNVGSARTQIVFGQGEQEHMALFRDILDCEGISFVFVDPGFGRTGYSVENKQWPKVEDAFKRWKPIVNDLATFMAQP